MPGARLEVGSLCCQTVAQQTTAAVVPQHAATALHAVAALLLVWQQTAEATSFSTGKNVGCTGEGCAAQRAEVAILSDSQLPATAVFGTPAIIHRIKEVMRPIARGE